MQWFLHMGCQRRPSHPFFTSVLSIPTALPTSFHLLDLRTSPVSVTSLAQPSGSQDFHIYVISWGKKASYFLISQKLTRMLYTVGAGQCVLIEVDSLWHSLATMTRVWVAKQRWWRKSDLNGVVQRVSVLRERETVHLIKDQLLWGQVQELSAM